MTIFEEVKELVDVPTAARHYGVEVHHSNMALCPFHRDRNPSCKLYDDHYYCFGCQAHGDIINLVQKIFGLSPIEAVKQINNDFGLGLDVDKPPDMEAVSRRYREIVERKAVQANIERMYDILLRYYTLLDRYKIRYAPKSPDDEINERYVYAVHHIEYAWYLLENFNRTDAGRQSEIKLEVDRIEREYKRILDEWGE
ncbi:MAG: CHC2 zinc finger domain-containing protein [Ruminococcus sp.]